VPQQPYAPTQPQQPYAPTAPGQPYAQPTAGQPGQPYPPPTAGQPQQPFAPPTAGQPPYPQSAPPYPQSGPPYPQSGPPYPQSGPPYGQPPFTQPQGAYPLPPTGYLPAGGMEPSPRGRRGLVIGIVIAALVVIVGGGGAGAFLLTRDTGKGQATPGTAMDSFFTAVYTDNSVTEASKYVCSSSRDQKKLTTKINQIKQQDAKYDGVKYSWSSPQSKSSGKDETILTTTVTLTTSNEQKATQNLRVVTTRHNGWWVCEIQQTG
jgi:hypothetical protein